MTWCLDILGGFELRGADGPAPLLPRKTRALLAYLAVQRPRPVAREEAAELLWPDRGAEQVRHSLRQCLSELRRLTGDQELIATRDSSLALPDRLVLDAEPLLRPPPGGGAGEANGAAHAYTGQLLQGFPPVSPEFDDWLSLTRDRVEAAALSALDRIARLATEAGDTVGALEATQRMFAIDPLREDTHRRLLQACAAAGRRSEALRHYEAIVGLLRRELGVAPSRETRELAQQLRREMDPAPPETPPAAAVPAQPRSGFGPPIAVLPYRMFGDAALGTHLRDGLVADMVCQLAGLRELSVISHGSTQNLTDPNLDLRDVGRMLGVSYVVRGAIRGDRQQLRLTTELADARSGMVVWARSHDVQGGLSFEDQDRVVAQIVNTLAPRIHEMELRRVRGMRPEQMGIYEKVLLVREHLQTLERERFVRARVLLDEVEEAEPGYAEAYALDADWHGLWIGQGWTTDRAGDIASIERLSRHALSLDGDNVRALTFYAHRKSLLHRDYTAARAMFARALELSPSSASAWLWSSLTFAYVGEAEEAMRRADRALKLSPRDRKLADFYAALCIAHYTAGDWRGAAEWGERALAVPGALYTTYRWAAAALSAQGRQSRAKEIALLGMLAQPGQTVGTVIAQHPYQDDARRAAYASHLIAAGFPA